MNPKQSRYYTFIRPVLKNKFARTYSPLIFSLLTIAIFSYYAIRPTVTTILSLQKSINEQTSILNRLQEKRKNLTLGRQNFEQINGDIKVKLISLIPNSPELLSIINTITYLAKKSESSSSGIQIQKVTLEQNKNKLNKDAAITPIEFTLVLQGSFVNLMNFLTAIKRADRLITVHSVNFVQPPEGALIMSLTAKAYYLKN